MAKENINLDFRLKIYERKKFFWEEKKNDLVRETLKNCIKF